MMRSDKLEDEALLNGSSGSETFSDIESKSFFKKAWKMLLFHLALVLAYCASLTLIYRSAQQCHGLDKAVAYSK